MRYIIRALYYFIRYDIPRGVRNLIRWFPIVWGDRDWDSHFLFKILRFKLKNMEELFRKYGNGINSERDADKIKICVMLLDRITGGEYGEMVFRHHDKKWGDGKITYSKSDRQGCSTINISRERAVTVKEKEQERKEAGRLYKHEDMLLLQDVEYLFKLMNKYILGWWD